MSKLKLAGASIFITILLVGCQINMPFNKASEKLRDVAVIHAIPAHEEIVIGEFQDSPYQVFINNKAKTAIKVFVIDRNTNFHTQSFLLQPEHDATVYAQKYEKVVFQNSSDLEINVDIGMNKEVEGWRTQPVKDYEAERME
jgi:hypothetical protein